jgi:hypothetical protein
MALAVGILWQVLIVVAIVLAALLLWRRRLAGLGHAALVLTGSLLCWGFVSAAVGLAENFWSVSSAGFLAATAVGVVGAGLFVLGALGLRPLEKHETPQRY